MMPIEPFEQFLKISVKFYKKKDCFIRFFRSLRLLQIVVNMPDALGVSKINRFNLNIQIKVLSKIEYIF
jgi:hypothetical protein